MKGQLGLDSFSLLLMDSLMMVISPQPSCQSIQYLVLYVLCVASWMTRVDRAPRADFQNFKIGQREQETKGTPINSYSIIST
jgi:hypothetical protein